ncbi:uncharacterized protein F4812DRAFT_437675 [Daldinia caldariorum]|uniref:uncharacterized protein n=1 Tax=Daldinia caldariorum TaxID=326644 RepID=UPI0020074E24|nr:uncharacterized protein F4812DRAFT_437675 [Daldinia caldariorum]KAI1465819.1 hypothetical protein F4812DRAFT_437675 [Daldinia caldariorum]
MSVCSTSETYWPLLIENVSLLFYRARGRGVLHYQVCSLCWDPVPLKCTMVTYKNRDCQSLANFIEGFIRDVVLVYGVTEATPVVLLHAMAESFTDKMIDIYFRLFPRRRVQGTIKHPIYTPKGETIHLRMPHGLYNDAMPRAWRFLGSEWQSSLRGAMPLKIRSQRRQE